MHVVVLTVARDAGRDGEVLTGGHTILLGPTDQGVVVLGNQVEPLAATLDAFLALYLGEAPLWPRGADWALEGV